MNNHKSKPGIEFMNNKNFKLFLAVVLLALIGCETPNQNHDASTTHQGYTRLNQDNPKDKVFLVDLENGLKNLGSLISVYVDTEELNLYREGKRPYPTNYRYIIKANPKISLEEIKRANLSLQD